MADVSLKIRAEKFGKSLQNLAETVEEELNQAVNNLAHQAYGIITNKVQTMQMGDSIRKDYLAGLSFHELGTNTYVISLDGELANRFEGGFGAYSIREQLLKSTKTVTVGPRAGEPWVKTAKDGHKYAAVPFQHFPDRKQSKGLGEKLKQTMAKGLDGTVQQITKTFKDIDGNPLKGKVATSISGPDANLQGLTKFQHVHDSGRVSNVYMTWRVASENGKDWIHPGWSGYHLFRQVEEFIEDELDHIIQDLLK